MPPARRWVPFLMLPGVVATLWMCVAGSVTTFDGSAGRAASPYVAEHAAPSAPAGPATDEGNVGQSLLSLMNVRPSIDKLQLPSVEQVKHRLIGESEVAPLHLSSDPKYVPFGFEVHSAYAKLTCPLTAYELLTHIQHEMSVLQCSEKCAKWDTQECQYAVSFQSGACALFSACSSLVESPEYGTAYFQTAYKGVKRYAAEAHRKAHADGAAAQDVTHLYRLNKTVSQYHFHNPHGDVVPPCIDRGFGEEYAKIPKIDTQIPELGIDHVYMVHYTPLVTRRAVITKQHLVQGIRSDWMTSFDHQNITSDMRTCIHQTWTPNAYKNPQKQQRKVPSPNVSPGGFKGGELSVNTKHHFIYYNIVKRGFGLSLVVEDDAKLRSGFRQWWVKVMKTVPNEFDIVMFGGCLKMFGWRAKSRAVKLTPNLYEKQEARCAHAYAVTLGGAKKLLASMPLTDVIDYQINRVIKETNMKVFWVEPWLAVQGPVGEAGQPRKTMTSGGDGEPFNPDNAADPTWIDTWLKPVPPQPLKSFKVPTTSSKPICINKDKSDCWWL